MRTMFEDLQDRMIEGVLSVTGPKAELVPMVFDSPHSGLTIPDDFEPAVSAERVLVAADTHVDDLFSSAPGIGAPLLAAQFPRSFLDVNRSLLDMDKSMVGQPWPHPVRDSATARRGMGLMWRFAWGDELMHARPLTVEEAENRIIRYWQPYHRSLTGLLNAVYARFGRVYHINCHSMTAVGHAISSDPAGTLRDDICIGDMRGTSASAEFVELIADTLRGEGLSVALNKPFRGAELIEAYSNPAHGRHSVQFEINRRLYMDETTRQRTEGYDDLKAALARMNRVLADYARAQI
ncbi:N-formylglutamate amidohydrolase [Rhizobiaceae bacterium BDR2-2]|uniref:N-formylglutamate amidohydrolase n=1 Tax=Ectorhizobium quercum TaxID=2965071 RepID=A0AAE3MWU3_9HYPH|nr:N-formylglutamate amidohydrolase [Ectorhizobium quercum]MCX8995891.1 N-formylglutamate amidohydrolase [Ectorhizobium quercum]